MEAKIDDVKRKTDGLKASGYLTDTGVLLSPVSIVYINIKYTVHPVTDSSVLLSVSVIYTYQSNVLNLKIYQFFPLNKGNNKITELRTILQRESQNS
jgi:hypothetical protein